MSRRGWPRACLALLLAGAAAADDGAWRLEVGGRRDLPTGGAARVEAIGDGSRQDLRIAILAPGRHRARAFAAAPDRDAFAAARAAPGVVVAINGGYFDGERRPLGRLVVDGAELAALRREAPLSGIAWSTGAGLRLAAVGTPVPATQAMQAGPFLIDPGGSFGIRRQAGAAARRSALAVAGDGTVLAVVATTPTTLHAFARVLQALPAALDLPPLDAALNLDGGPSTALEIAGEDAVAAHGFVVSAWGFAAATPPP